MATKPSAAGIAALLQGDTGARMAALAQLSALADAAAVDADSAAIATECIRPLVEATMCADASQLGGASEVRQASNVLSRLTTLGNGYEMVYDGRLNPWFAPGGWVEVGVGRPVAEYTRDGIVVEACVAAAPGYSWVRSYGDACRSQGFDEAAGLTQWMTCPYEKGAMKPSTDQRNEAMALRVLEICRDPGDLSQAEIYSLWALLYHHLAQRPAVFAATIRAGLFSVAHQALVAAGSPDDWVQWRHPSSAQAGFIWAIICHAAMTSPAGVDVIKEICDSGFAKLIIETLSALERLGSDQVEEDAAVMPVVHVLLMLQQIDLTASAAAPIVAMLFQIPSALQFTLEHNLTHFEFLGIKTSSVCAAVCAVVWGKEEHSSGFEFTQTMIDNFIVNTQDIFSGQLAPYFELSSHWLRALQHLCVSDLNKNLLCKCSKTVPLLLDMLLLDLNHCRKDVDLQIKAAIQADATDCLLQLALYEPGRALLAQDSTARDALKALTAQDNEAHNSGGALSEQVKLSADGALLALLGKANHETNPDSKLAMVTQGQKHIMLSCELVS
eukprot:COSAG02_NODE_4029_length_5885_cov_88.549430_4_plen_556_part_00